MRFKVNKKAIFALSLIQFSFVISSSSNCYASNSGAPEYMVAPGMSSVIFRIKNRQITYVYGRFNELAGRVIFAQDDPSKIRVYLTVQANSIDTNNERRDNHLRNEDFFEVGQYPEIIFKTKSARKVENDSYELSGDLTMHGVTKTVKVQFTHTGTTPVQNDTERIGGECTFTVNRSDFGMDWGIPGTGDEVTITASLEAKRSL